MLNPDNISAFCEEHGIRNFIFIAERPEEKGQCIVAFSAENKPKTSWLMHTATTIQAHILKTELKIYGGPQQKKKAPTPEQRPINETDSGAF